MEKKEELSQMTMAELIELVLELRAEVFQFKEENKLLKNELAVAKKSRPSLR